jgi:hypothetical protein
MGWDYTRGEPLKVEVTSPQPTARDEIKQQFVGTWRLQKVDGFNTEIFTFSVDGTWSKTTVDTLIYTFNADGRTGTYVMNGNSVNFTWTVIRGEPSPSGVTIGGKINITHHARSGDFTYYYNFTLRDNGLGLAYEGPSTFALIRQ